MTGWLNGRTASTGFRDDDSRVTANNCILTSTFSMTVLQPQGPKRLARLGLLASSALILFLLDSLAPRPLPWMKLGLGNLPVVVALEFFGGVPALGVALVKICGGGLVSGGFATPTFVIGGVSAIASVVVMAQVRRLTGRFFSLVGISILGAVTHQLTQLLVAYFYINHGGMFSFLPLFLITGLATGFLIGLIAHWCVVRLRRLDTW